jgi:mono/diheme cytochrome c family protein
MPEIPDFTKKEWQEARSDGELIASVADGKGTLMPTFGGKLKDDQIRGLVHHVRGFASQQPHPNSTTPGDFDERFRQLQKERKAAEREFWSLLQREQAQPENACATGQLFQQLCAKCHSADGKGRDRRSAKTQIPEFCDSSWQARKSDEELRASILNGRGSEMPAWHDRISPEQATRLVAYVRRFAAPRPRRGSRPSSPRPSPSTGM